LIRSIDEFVEEENRFYPKISFLKDIPIRVLPTDLEIKTGILIPGHRLLPFYPMGGPVDDISLVYRGKPIKTKIIALKMSELHIYFNLMDLHKIPIINVEDILEKNADLEIKVFNLEKFYKIHDFMVEDTIILKSVDFIEGVFSLEYDSHENYQSHIFEIQRLDKLFMDTLKKVLEKGIFFPNVEKQLLYTYFYLKKNHRGKWLWPQPGTALGPLISKNKKITFTSLSNGRTIFHFVHQSPDEFVDYPDFEDLLAAKDEEPDLTTITGALQSLNNPYNITIVRALIFEQITNRKNFNYPEIEKYLFDGCEKPYIPQEFQKVLKTLLKEEYNKIKDGFDLKYAYLPITTAREKILEQSLVISGFLQSLDEEMVEPDELPKKEMMHLMELIRSFDEMLLELETLQLEGTDDVSEIHRVIKIIEKTASELPNFFKTIREKLGF
jgi:hypothetical protein